MTIKFEDNKKVPFSEARYKGLHRARSVIAKRHYSILEDRSTNNPLTIRPTKRRDVSWTYCDEPIAKVGKITETPDGVIVKLEDKTGELMRHAAEALRYAAHLLRRKNKEATHE